jgi:DNA polymerase
MTRLHRDYETYSPCDIKKQGHHRYVRHPGTEALMLGWAIDDGEVRVWDIAGGEPLPGLLAEAYADPGVLLWAYNAAFERGVDQHVMHLDLPLERYRCGMVQGYALSLGGQTYLPKGVGVPEDTVFRVVDPEEDYLPKYWVEVQETGALHWVPREWKRQVAKGLEAMLLEMDAPPEYWKDREGKRLIDRFSKPQPPSRKVPRWDRRNDPEGYAKFMDYCAQDVVAERWLYHRLAAYSPMTDADWAEWHMDQRINERGIPVDMALVDAVLQIIDTEKAALMRRLREATGLENPNSRDQVLGWLRDNGLGLTDLRKETIAKYVKGIEENEDDE